MNWKVRSFKFEARNPNFQTKMLSPKIKTLNSKQTQMSRPQNSKPYDLENNRFNCCEVKITF
jgi:hypothetical protein